MTEDFTELEQELKAIRPRPLSEGLRQRIANELEPAPGIRADRDGLFQQWMGYAALAAAAALLLITVAYRFSSVEPDPGNDAPTARAVASAEPVGQPTNRAADDKVIVGTMLVGQRYEGPVFVKDGRQVRVVRRQMVDHVQWDSRAEGTNHTMTRPREEVVLVPVEVY